MKNFVKKLSSMFLATLFVLIVAMPTLAMAVDYRLTWTAPDDARVVGYNIYFGEKGSDFKASPYASVDGQYHN
jgi:hypothetical protein